MGTEYGSLTRLSSIRMAVLMFACVRALQSTSTTGPESRQEQNELGKNSRLATGVMTHACGNSAVFKSPQSLSAYLEQP